jgi:hypothetical protein
MRSPISTTLSKFDELYGAAPVTESAPSTTDASDIPDGEYDVVVEDVAFSQDTTTPKLVWTFRIRDGSYSGRVLRKVRPVTERTVVFVKEDLTKCGMQLDTFSDLPNRIEELRGACLPVLKRDGDFGVHLQWPSKARPHST